MKNLLGKIINIIFGFVKVKDNCIVFFSSRNRVDGNPKAIYLYLKKHYPKKYKIKYLVYKSTDVSELDKKDVCYYKTLKCCYYIAKAKYWILSDSVKTVIKKKKNQLYIQTFHGHGPIKNGAKTAKNTGEIIDCINGVVKHAVDWDVYIAMCKEDEDVIRAQTGFNKKFFTLGVPSMDSIVESKDLEENKIIKLKNKYNIPLDKKVVLYAPTYRNDLLDKDDIKIEIEDLKDFKDYVFLIRLHPLLNSKIDKSIFENSNFINCCNVPDIVDLYPVVDILISDYSSSIHEFALTNKKIILFPYDYEKYDYSPGFSIDYKNEMPGPICYNKRELYEVFKYQEKYFKNYAEKLKKFNKKYSSMNDGNATKRFVDYLINRKFEGLDENK